MIAKENLSWTFSILITAVFSFFSSTCAAQQSGGVQRPQPFPPQKAQANAPWTPPEQLYPIVELTKAIKQKLVSATGSGSDISSVTLKIELVSQRPLRVEVRPGTIFRSDDYGTQNMVTRDIEIVSLTRAAPKVEVSINASCANMRRATPESTDTFSTIELVDESSDLAALTRSPQLRTLPLRVQQFAVWTVTDNPSRDGYVGIGSFAWAGKGPSDEEIKQIERLFLSVGIKMRRYQVFGGKPPVASFELEEIAMRELGETRRVLAKRPELAKRALQAFMKKYPDTEAAREAKRLLNN